MRDAFPSYVRRPCDISGSLVHAQTCECFFEQCGVDRQAAPLCLYVFNLIEGAKKPEFDGAVLFGIGQKAAVHVGPARKNRIGKKHTDRISKLPVGGDVENELSGGSFRIIRDGRAFAHEVVLVDVALGPGIGFQAADGHRVIIRRGLKFVS